MALLPSPSDDPLDDLAPDVPPEVEMMDEIDMDALPTPPADHPTSLDEYDPSNPLRFLYYEDSDLGFPVSVPHYPQDDGEATDYPTSTLLELESEVSQLGENWQQEQSSSLDEEVEAYMLEDMLEDHSVN